MTLSSRADNPINQTILSMFMKKKGISYKVAKDGEQAVQMWKKGNFHLVLVRALDPTHAKLAADDIGIRWTFSCPLKTVLRRRVKFAKLSG